MHINSSWNSRYLEVVQVVLFGCELSIFKRDFPGDYQLLEGKHSRNRACRRHHMFPVGNRVSNFSRAEPTYLIEEIEFIEKCWPILS